MLAIFAAVMTVLAIVFGSLLLISMSAERATEDHLDSSVTDRLRLQHMLQQQSETIDANNTDMADMRTKLSSHAEEIMQLRVSNEKLEDERDVLHAKLNDALETLGLIDSLRSDAMQRLTNTE